MTVNGGTNDYGVLFEYDPIIDVYTKKLDFDGTNKGANPWGSLMQASNGKLYGMTYRGGASNFGVIFEYDPSSDIFIKKLDFIGVNGASPLHTTLIQVGGSAPPVAVCKNTILQLGTDGKVTLEASAIDGGSTGNNITLSVSKTNFMCADVGDNIVTLTVTDINGNKSTCDATVTVLDVTAPMIVT